MVRPSAFFKDIGREFRRTLSRFFSLFFISALGVAIYAGIQYTSPDMRLTADEFYKAQGLSDFRLLSTYGFDGDDIRAVRDTPGVALAVASFSCDAYVHTRERAFVVKAMALPGPDPGTSLNRPLLLDGRFPERSGECLVEPSFLQGLGYSLGDTVTLFRDEGEDVGEFFSRADFVIVGVAQDPQYISLERGNSALGGGTVDRYMHILPEDFALEYHTEIYVEMENGKSVSSFSDAYKRMASELEESLRRTGEARSAERFAQILSDAGKAIEETKQNLRDGVAARDEALAGALRRIAEAEDELEIGRAALAGAGLPPAALEDARRKINEAELELEAALAEYANFAAESARELENARLEIEDAERGIGALKAPVWYVLDRDQLPGFAGYAQNTDRIKAIGAVFPALFFLVAVLVGLTSMTRMVDERRTQLGVFKALGYGRFSILSKYILYALTASLAGSLFGFALGRGLLPEMISRAYGILYDMPPLLRSSIPGFAASALCAAAGSVVGATLLACIGETALTPAALMRPKPPAKGKRILLERVRPLWRRMSFIGKVTARNLFRYKKRFFMTALGVTGCSALLITGLGLRNSIMDMAPRQFIELSRYDVQIGYDGKAAPAELDEMKALLDDPSLFRDYLLTGQSAMRAQAPGTPAYSVSLVVTSDPARLSEFLVMRTRKGHDPVPLGDDGAVLSEKLASLLGVRPGDAFTLTGEDNTEYTLTVTGVIEHYVYHYVYLTQNAYERVFGTAMTENTVIAAMADPETEHELSLRLMALDAVRGLRFTTAVVRDVGNMVQALNFVVYVLIVSAAALAFIVLFNLTNINIGERVRELATIKVLGFTAREVSMYIQRENLWITGIGVAAGCVAGFFLHRYVILTSEVDLVMFTRDIHWESYLYSVLLTFGFSIAVNLVMLPRLARIDMVESLKSVE